jgi:hypothetical protein
MRRVLALLLPANLFCSPLIAQEEGDIIPKTARRCVGTASALASRRASELADTSQAARLAVRQRVLREEAARCLATIDTRAQSVLQLPALALIYAIVGRNDSLGSTVDRILATKATVDQKGKTLAMLVMSILGEKGTIADARALAETVSERMAALPTEANRHKMAAHRQLIYYYGRLGDEGVKQRMHADSVLSLAQSLPFEVQSQCEPQVRTAMEALVTLHLFNGFADSAKALATRENALIGGGTSYEPERKKGAIRLELVGRRGVDLSAQIWFNASPGMKKLELDGKITVVDFSSYG